MTMGINSHIQQLIFSLVLLILFTSTCFAREPIRVLECMVDRTLDGDTVSVVVRNGGGTRIKVRLYGIDAPETDKIGKKSGKVFKPGQPYGEEAMNALESKVRNAILTVKVYDIDKYKRMVGVLSFGNRNINLEMIQGGWAWAYRQYLDTPYASEYIAAEEQARSQKKGLWAQSNPQPPWEFRKLQKKSKKES